MKRNIYIFCAVIFGILLSTILHALVESWYIGLLISDFGTYSFGFSWAAWFTIHSVATGVLFFLGVLFGYWLGVRWWQMVYVERRHWLFRHKR
jgi:hypothetical protein